jgi:hypothetical protein
MNRNFDGTTFTVGGSGGDKVDVKILKEKGKKSREKIQKEEVLPSAGNKVLLIKDDASFIKYSIGFMLPIVAQGLKADPIYKIAEDNMTEEEFRAIKVKSLGVGTNHLDNAGWIVMMK